MRARTSLLALVLALSACSSSTAPNSSPTIQSNPTTGGPAIGGSETVTVQRVVDGDTFIALAGGSRFRVRLIGVNTPETVKPGAPIECFGPEASAYAHRLLTGKEVRLVYDIGRYDRYHRVLAYVYLGKLFVNLDLVQRGYAVVETVPPDVAHVAAFVTAQRAARAEHAGLWLACTLH